MDIKESDYSCNLQFSGKKAMLGESIHMQGDIQCNYMDVQRVTSDASTGSSSFPPLPSLSSLLSPPTPFFPLRPPPPLTWEPDEALMESTGSQHLPHLRRTGRSLLLSVPPRASLSSPPCSPLLPPSPTASSAESPLNVSIVCPGEPREPASVFFCLSLMCADVQQAPFFCRGTSGTSDLGRDNSSCQAGGG